MASNVYQLGGMSNVPNVIAQDQRTAVTNEAPRHREFMFVCGVPRSGTTALGGLLNLHPQIALGVERFRKLALSGPTDRLFTPALFNSERFFSFQPGDTNVRADAVYKRMQSKFGTAIFVGDKIPRLYVKFSMLMERFDRPNIIYIVRDLAAVARSWNARADNPADAAWPESNDYKKAVVEWNRGNKLALRQLQDAPHSTIVLATKIYSRSGSTLSCR